MHRRRRPSLIVARHGGDLAIWQRCDPTCVDAGLRRSSVRQGSDRVLGADALIDLPASCSRLSSRLRRSIAGGCATPHCRRSRPAMPGHVRPTHGGIRMALVMRRAALIGPRASASVPSSHDSPACAMSAGLRARRMRADRHQQLALLVAILHAIGRQPICACGSSVWHGLRDESDRERIDAAVRLRLLADARGSAADRASGRGSACS